MARIHRAALAALLASGLAQPASAQGGAIIPPGRYLCKAGNSRMMLTLGEMEVSGTSYVFHAPTGPDTAGTYRVGPNGFVWLGNIGAITNAQIVESGLDRSPDSFWFTYRGDPRSSPTTASCSML